VAGRPSPREEAFALFVHGQTYMARTDRYKLIRGFQERPQATDPWALRPDCYLFDLQTDPLETVDVVDEPAHAGARREMDARLWRWLDAVDDPVLRGPVPTPTHLKVLENYQAWRDEHG
jgi:arylsulfatase A-like enzyme